jgi:hypothetical protein
MALYVIVAKRAKQFNYRKPLSSHPSTFGVEHSATLDPTVGAHEAPQLVFPHFLDCLRTREPATGVGPGLVRAPHLESVLLGTLFL